MTAYYSDRPRRAWRESMIQKREASDDASESYLSAFAPLAVVFAVPVSLGLGIWFTTIGPGWMVFVPLVFVAMVIFAHHHITTVDPAARRERRGVTKIMPDRDGAVAAVLHACLHPDTQEIAEIAAGTLVRRGFTTPPALKDVIDAMIQAWGITATLPTETAQETRTWLLALAHDLPATEEASTLTHSTLKELTHRLREAAAGQERIETAITTAPASTDLMSELADEAHQAHAADARATAVREQLDALSSRIQSDATIYNAVASEITSRSTDSDHI